VHVVLGIPLCAPDLNKHPGTCEHQPDQAPERRTSDDGSHKTQGKSVWRDHSQQEQDCRDDSTRATQGGTEHNEPFSQVRQCQGAVAAIADGNHESAADPEADRGAQNHNGGHIQPVRQGSCDQAHDHGDNHPGSRDQDVAPCGSGERLRRQREAGEKPPESDQETEVAITSETERQTYEQCRMATTRMLTAMMPPCVA